MRITFNLLIATIAATGLLALAVGGASARRIAADSSYEARGEWAIGFGGAISVECKLTLEGTFHSASFGTSKFSKVSGALVGLITRGQNGTCAAGTGGRALLETLPWHIRYQSFSGTLPSIREIQYQIVGAAIRIAISASNCLITTTAARPLIMRWTISVPRVLELRFLASAIAPELACSWPGEAIVAGTFGIETGLGGSTIVNLVT